ncbi:MAG: MBL fold metallo-hydrolase [Deltaproteobacteria bacterium]|nr:MBL fold metallo-hydrolase [Deltaproteobacteria bacterium]
MTTRYAGRTALLAALFTLMPLHGWAEPNLIKLAEGVFGIKGPGGTINTGLVVGDRGVFVYSCSADDYDQRVQLIRSVAGGRPIRYVANGHYAGDDTMCNHLFAEQGAVVLGSKELARQLLPYWPKRVEEELRRGRVKKEYLLGKKVEMAMPVITFGDKVTLDLGSHVVELLYVGKAHTPDNTIAYLPKERILFVNDLLFVELHPTADARSDTMNWQRVLRKLATWPVETVVPGHGAFAPGNGAKPLLEMDRYFETMRAKVRAMKGAGKSLDEIKRGIRAELGDFARWPREGAIPGTAEQLYRELTARP